METFKVEKKEINVFLSPHAIERLRERLGLDNLSERELAEKLNRELNRGFIKRLKDEENTYLLGFESAPNFYFVIKGVEPNYFAKTAEWRLLYNPPNKEVRIKYYFI